MSQVTFNCPNCGSPIQISAERIPGFCRYCGTKFNAYAIQNLLIEKTPNDPVIEKQRRRDEYRNARKEIRAQRLRTKSLVGWISISITAIIVFIILFILLFVMS